MKLLFIPFLIGAMAGILGALCGVGGGIIMVPAFTALLGMEQKTALATSLAVIIPTALVATGRFTHEKLIDWQIFIPTAIGAVLAAFFASGWVKDMSSLTLTRIFGGLLIVVGVMTLLKKG